MSPEFRIAYEFTVSDDREALLPLGSSPSSVGGSTEPFSGRRSAWPTDAARPSPLDQALERWARHRLRLDVVEAIEFGYGRRVQAVSRTPYITSA